MILVMDVGNTNIVLGLYEKKQLLHHWRMTSNRNNTDDEYGTVIKAFLQDVGVKTQNIKAVIISSVVPPLILTLERMSKKYLNHTPVVVGPGIKTGLNIKIDNPRELGADRIVNAMAALDLYGPPLIIVDLGTATTFCMIDEKGQYIGGAISPGIGISTEALYSRAAKLTWIELLKPPSVIGKNTVQAMQSGVIFGAIGQVDGIVSRMKQESSLKPKVIATGGLAELIASESKTIDIVNPDLTLHGLWLVYEKNCNE